MKRGDTEFESAMNTKSPNDRGSSEEGAIVKRYEPFGGTDESALFELSIVTHQEVSSNEPLRVLVREWIVRDVLIVLAQPMRMPFDFSFSCFAIQAYLQGFHYPCQAIDPAELPLWIETDTCGQHFLSAIYSVGINGEVKVTDYVPVSPPFHDQCAFRALLANPA